jgi:hypothetical protein
MMKEGGTMEGRYTAVDSIPGLVAGLRKTWKSGKTLDLEWRLQQLRQLIKMLKENENQVHLLCATPAAASSHQP